MKSDFDFGNLIYILITLAFVIFGAAGKKKKRPVSYVTENEPEAPKSDSVSFGGLDERLNKLMSEYLDVNEPVAETSVEYGYQAAEQYNSAFTPDTQVLDDRYSSLDRVESEEGQRTIYRMSDHTDDIQKSSMKKMTASKNKLPSYTQNLMKEFDSKKAFLYSEIFKPKYF